MRAQAPAAYEAEVLRLVNQERAAQTPPLPPLQLSPQLQRAAEKYARSMGDAGFFGHVGLDGSTPPSRISDEGYPWIAFGENIAAGQQDPAAVMDAWMNSPGHRANILNPKFREIGVGCAVAAGNAYGILWVEDFGARSESVVPPMPGIIGVEPARAYRGTAVTLYGANFGDRGSVVFAGDANGVVADWSPTRIVVTVPDEAQTGSVYVRTNAGSSNVTALQVDEPPPPPVLPGFAPRNRLAVFRSTTREWFLRDDSGNVSVVQFGGPGDQPLAADYLGTGRAQIAVFRPSTNDWFIRADNGGTVQVKFGVSGDQPVPADYLGLGRAQIAVFRPSTREWLIRKDDGTAAVVSFGGPGDQPVPADYFGLKRAQIAVFRPTTAQWFLRTDLGGTVLIPWGSNGDRPVPGNYFGAGRAQVAVYRPSTSEFILRQDNGTEARIQFGTSGDVPLPGDYNGIGRTQIAVFRPTTEEWFFRADSGTSSRIQFGGPGDQPVPAIFAFRFGM